MNDEYVSCAACFGSGVLKGLHFTDRKFTVVDCDKCNGKGYFKQPNIQEEIDHNEVLNEIQNKLINQTQKGLEKYGHTVQVDSMSTVEWLDHAIEEAIDKLVYLTCIKKSLEGEQCERD